MEGTTQRRLVLLLDEIRHEGIVSTINASGFQCQYADLTTQPVWNYLDSIDLATLLAVIGKFTVPALINLGSPDYGGINREALGRLKSVTNLIFIHSDLLSGHLLANFDEVRRRLVEPNTYSDQTGATIGNVFVAWSDVPALRRGVERLKESGLNVIAFKSNAEITVAAETFVLDAGHGLLFRMYVPLGQVWDAQIAQMIELFSDYLARVMKVKVRLDRTQTNCGVIFTFYADTVGAADGAEKFAEFSAFLDMCATDQLAASEHLRRYPLSSREIASIVEKYAKAAFRLRIDLRHERETKMLAVRHGLEIELAETTGLHPAVLSEIVNAAVPMPDSFADIESVSTTAAHAPTIVGTNFGTLHIGTIQQTVARELQGSITTTREDQELLTLFKREGGNESSALTSALYELNDASAPVGSRTLAKQKIRTFLLNLGEKVQAAALDILKAYIEKKTLGM